MTKTTLCLLFVLALIAQIATIPTDKDEADVDKAATKGKKEASDEGEDLDDALKATDKHKAEGADAVADSVDKVKKGERVSSHGRPRQHPHRPVKDCHKPHHEGPLSKAVDKTTDVEKKLADVGANAVKDFFNLFGV